MNYIIGISGSDMDDVTIYRVKNANKKKIRKYLVELVKKDRAEDPEYWDFGTTAQSEVESRPDGSLYAFGCWTDHHNDYVARPESSLQVNEVIL